jgi:hypothetical protein
MQIIVYGGHLGGHLGRHLGKANSGKISIYLGAFLDFQNPILDTKTIFLSYVDVEIKE